jgi:hypothetical protein
MGEPGGPQIAILLPEVNHKTCFSKTDLHDLHVMPPPPSEWAKNGEIAAAVNDVVMKAIEHDLASCCLPIGGVYNKIEQGIWQ